MMFASLTTPVISPDLQQTVEGRLSTFGYRLLPGGLGTFDIVDAQSGRVLWVNSSLGEIAKLNEWLLASLRRTDRR